VTATAYLRERVVRRRTNGVEQVSADFVAPRRQRRARLVKRSLAIADVTGLAVAFLVSTLVFSNGTSLDSLRGALWILLFLGTLPLWLLLAGALELYSREECRADHSTADETFAVISLVAIGTWLVVAVGWATGLAHPNAGRLIVFSGLALALILTGRAVARSAVRRMAGYVQTGVILGAGHVGQLVARKIQQHQEYGIRLLGFVDENPRARRAEVESVRLLGCLDDLPKLIASEGIDRVIVAFSKEPDARTMVMLRSLRDREVIVDTVPRLYELVGPRAEVHLLEGLPLITVPPTRLPRSARILKRAIDIVGAGALLVVTAPFFLIAAYRIKRESDGPVFFRQTRLGMHMQPFTFLKFRTMRLGTGDAEHRAFIRQTMSADACLPSNGVYKLARESDVTPFGSFLRRTSLDELPQLINVLRGDMSLIGPRPCLEYETEHFAPHHFDRFAVPQGIAGLWQVTARANSTFGEALEMDVEYVHGWSLGLDLRLMFRTPFALIHQRKATS
jgi:exopolysaccharide biosynthesis polyprenyl glycosylphosphotransferase